MSEKDITIIGIGASAGGLEALQSFIGNLPLKSNMAYIIAQHLSPTYKSLMVELLSKGTSLNVLPAAHGIVAKANTIYVCPPDENIFLDGNTILLAKPKADWNGPKPSVDLFFESLAESKQEESIGIILSGTGSDGSRGIRAIKAAGGFTIVQEPLSAKYDGMPNSAIQTGTVDLILQPEDIGKELEEMLSYVGQILLKRTESASTSIYKNILTKIREIKGVDFNLYKPSTIERRIERRMIALKIIKISDYYTYLVQNTDEAELLFKDILIGVTKFFRDGESFYVLKNQIAEYLKTKTEKHIRIWSPGCSTGEEAYSLAMILSEILGADIANYRIQIFATDINEDALYFARKGIYPESALLSLDNKLLNKYFVIKGEHFEVIKPIREMVIFSRHNILRDPAFLRLDLLVCRNLLIYFSQELQKKLFPEFHYALNDNALLFLGKSESVGHFQSYFKTVDKQWKIYKTNFLGTKELPRVMHAYQKNDLINSAKIISEIKKPTLNDRVIEYVNEKIIPMCVVINENMDIVYIKGNNPYLVRPSGGLSQNIFKNVNTGLSIEVRAAIHATEKSGETYKSNFQKIILLDKIERFVRVVVVPMNNKDLEKLTLICFQEEENENFKHYVDNGDIENNPENKKLEEELRRTKDYLQTVIEELETSNEEMQSLNEELQSSNEELQSSNEELETTNEELQSTNEELQTAYTEVRAIYDEREESAKEMIKVNKKYELVNIRLAAALECSGLGICDYHLPIISDDYWSEQWAEILGYNLGELPADKSHMVEWITTRVHQDDLADFHVNYKNFVSGKTESCRNRFRMEHKKNGYIWLESFAMASARDYHGNVSHVVGTLKDITTEMELQNNLKEASKIANIGTWKWNIANDSIWWSDILYDIFEFPKDIPLEFKTIVSSVLEEDRELYQKNVEMSLETGEPHNLVFRINGKAGIKTIWARGSASYDKHNNPITMVGIVQNITSSKENEALLETTNKYIDSIVKSSFNGIYIYNFKEENNTFINPEYTSILGYTMKDLSKLKNNSFLELFHPDDLDEIFKHMGDVQNSLSNEALEITYRFKHKNGDFVKVISRDCIITRDEDGSPVEMLGTFKKA